MLNDKIQRDDRRNHRDDAHIDTNVEMESDVHYTISSMIEAKDTTLRENQDAIERRTTVYNFTNLRDTMTEEEQNEAGREEITNFGSTFKAAQINIAPLESIVTGTDNLLEIEVDTNDYNRDHLLAVEIANTANHWLFNNNEKFHHIWRTCIGEGYLTGGGALNWDDKDSGLFPHYNKDMFFPKGSKLDPDEMTFAYERREMSIHDLHELIASADEDETYIKKSAIEAMIEELKEKMATERNYRDNERSGVDLDQDSARDNGYLDRVTFNVWIYWEVRVYPMDYEDKDKQGHKYVSKVMFIDNYIFHGDKYRHNDKKDRRQPDKFEDALEVIIYQEKEAFEDPREWLVMLIFDEEIGGEKTVDTLRGIAEAFYKPAVLIEELRNLEIEGALMTARPTLIAREGADPDEVLDYQMGVDLFAPDNIEVLQLPNTGSQVRPVVADLLQTVSGISGSSNANTGRGQELRQQAIERQQNSDIIKTNRTIKTYLKLDNILDLIVGRAMTLDPPAGTDDYRLIKGFQKSIDAKIVEIYNLDQNPEKAESLLLEDKNDKSKKAMKEAAKIRKRVASRTYSKFKYLKVKTRRNSVGLDRPTEIQNAEFILRMIETGRVPAQNVPLLMERAIAYQTQNPDIAGLMVNKPERISTEQQERAANEFDTIIRRAAAGAILPIGAKDIHEDHVEAHILDTIGFVNSHGLRPWDQLSVAQFTAAVQHTASHIQVMTQRPESGETARQAMQELQEIVKQAGAIIQVLEEQRQQSQNEELSPDDRLKLAKEQKTYAEIEILGRQFGAKLEDNRDIARNRIQRARQNQERMQLLERQQLVGEINKDREFALKREQLRLQGEQRNNETTNKERNNK